MSYSDDEELKIGDVEEEADIEEEDLNEPIIDDDLIEDDLLDDEFTGIDDSEY